MAPLIVITGPTSSGKSGLAIDLAERWGGEIICADSRTVYKGMDIGTAKPSRVDRARVPHHLLDIVTPNERFTVRDFQQLARQAIVEIRTRGNVPLLVGGTGLYIASVVLEYEFSDDDEALRAVLSVKSVVELQTMIKEQRISMPTNAQNRRHLVGALVAGGHRTAARTQPDDNTNVVAITTEMVTLQERIAARAGQMFTDGVVQEARKLGDDYGWHSEAMTGNIYPLLNQVLDESIGQEEAIEKSIIRDRQLAKRQLTWLKRHSFVQWMTIDDARVYLDATLAAYRDQ